MQARVIRTIDKAGGLDNYLLGGKAARLRELGMGGWRLRAMMMRTDMVKERFQREREALGLLVGSEGVETVGTNETEEIDEDIEEEGDVEEDGDEEEDEEFEDEEEGDEGNDQKLKSPTEKGIQSSIFVG